MTLTVSRAIRALLPWAALLPAVGANAADMKMPPPLSPISAPPLVTEPAPTPTPRDYWCHLGAFAGAQHLAFDQKLVSNPYFPQPVPGINEHKGSGVRGLAGGAVGCNLVSNSLFGGFEFEVWTGFGPPIEHSGYALDPVADHLAIRDRLAFAGSLRAGFMFGSAIFYGKIGLAQLNTDLNTDYTRTKARETGVTPSDPWQIDVRYKSAASLSQTGLLVGLGLEYLVDQNWSTRAEVNYIFTGAEEFQSTVTSGTRCDANTTTLCENAPRQNLAGDKNTQSIHMGRSMVKFGVNRRF